MSAVLSPNDQLLLGAVSPSWLPDRLPEVLESRDSEDWSEVFSSSSLNRVDSFVASLVADRGVARVSEPVRAEWRARRMLHVFRNEFALSLALEIGSALASDGIEAMAYKGVDFQLRYYSADLPRGFGDIDIVVRGRDLDGVDGALERIGFQRSPAELPLRDLSSFHLHAVYSRSGVPFPLELHWAVDSPIFAKRDPVPALFRRSESDPALGVLRRPSEVDALILMCMHLFKHLGPAAFLPTPAARLKAILEAGGLIWIVDILHWLSCNPQPSPSALRDALDDFGATAAGALALRLAADLAGVETKEFVPGFDPAIPARAPQLTRFLYPDLVRGGAISAAGDRRRDFLLAHRDRLGFRLVRVLEAVLPVDNFDGDLHPTRMDRVWRYLRLPVFGVRSLLRVAAFHVRTRLRRAHR